MDDVFALIAKFLQDPADVAQVSGVSKGTRESIPSPLRLILHNSSGYELPHILFLEQENGQILRSGDCISKDQKVRFFIFDQQFQCRAYLSRYNRTMEREKTTGEAVFKYGLAFIAGKPKQHWQFNRPFDSNINQKESGTLPVQLLVSGDCANRPNNIDGRSVASLACHADSWYTESPTGVAHVVEATKCHYFLSQATETAPRIKSPELPTHPKHSFSDHGQVTIFSPGQWGDIQPFPFKKKDVLVPFDSWTELGYYFVKAYDLPFALAFFTQVDDSFSSYEHILDDLCTKSARWDVAKHYLACAADNIVGKTSYYTLRGTSSWLLRHPDHVYERDAEHQVLYVRLRESVADLAVPFPDLPRTGPWYCLLHRN